MPVVAAAGAIGAAVTGGAVAAGSIAATVIGGALVGAAAGAVVSAVTGGDIAKGAIIGAIGGGIIGGVGAAATGLSWLGTKEVSGGMISAAQGSGKAAAATRAGDPLTGLAAAKASQTAAPAMGQGLTFGQQAVLEGVKGGATALWTSDDTELEIAKMKYKPNVIPKLKFDSEKQPERVAQTQESSQTQEPAQEQAQTQAPSRPKTPAQQTADEILDLRSMVAQITPQRPKGALSVDPGSLSVAVNDEVA